MNTSGSPQSSDRGGPRSDPFQALTQGDVLPGTITNIVVYGVFVDVGDGVTGLAHRSELQKAGIARDSLKKGQAVRVRVLWVDREQRKVGLTLLQSEGKSPPPQQPPSVTPSEDRESQRQLSSQLPQISSPEIAKMRGFIEFLAELREDQEEEWRKVGYDPKVPVHRTRQSGRFTYYEIYPSHYVYSRDYSEGRYALGPQSLEDPKGSNDLRILNCIDTSLLLLTRMIQGIGKGRTTFQDGLHVLSTQESQTLFFNLSIYAGFYHFVPNWYDRYGDVGEKPQQEEVTFCEHVFSQMWLLPRLTEGEWQRLRSLASFRARDHLRYQYYMRKYGNNWGNLARGEGKDTITFHYADTFQFAYAKHFQLEEIDDCLKEVVAGEERRLRACIDKLCVPLTTLAQQRTTRKRSVVERITSPGGFLQSLQELLQIEQPTQQSAQEPLIVKSTLATASTALVKVKKVEQSGKSYIYYLVLTDPAILPEPYEFTLTYQAGSHVEEVILGEGVENDE